MITTIQLSEKTKKALDKVKSGKETYEEAIVHMMRSLEEKKRKNKQLLIEGYQEMAGESLKITKEFETIDEDFDWK